MQNALIFLFKSLTDIYMLAFLLRFVLQTVRGGYNNPLAQVVFKITSPLVVPARRILPTVGGFDTPTLAILVVLEIAVTFALLWLLGLSLPVPVLLLYSLLRLVLLVLWFYTGAIIVYAVLSWFGDRGMNPIGVMLGNLVEPVLRPARRLLPPISGFDVAPLLVILLLTAAQIALPLPDVLR
jgi:YggT family protein